MMSALKENIEEGNVNVNVNMVPQGRSNAFKKKRGKKYLKI